MVRDITVHRGDHQRRSSMVPCAMDRLRREFQQLGTLQGPDACRKAARISTRIQDAIPDPQRTQVVTENLFKIFLDFSIYSA